MCKYISSTVWCVKRVWNKLKRNNHSILKSIIIELPVDSNKNFSIGLVDEIHVSITCIELIQLNDYLFVIINQVLCQYKEKPNNIIFFPLSFPCHQSWQLNNSNSSSPCIWIPHFKKINACSISLTHIHNFWWRQKKDIQEKQTQQNCNCTIVHFNVCKWIFWPLLCFFITHEIYHWRMTLFLGRPLFILFFFHLLLANVNEKRDKKDILLWKTWS